MPFVKPFVKEYFEDRKNVFCFSRRKEKIFFIDQMDFQTGESVF